MFGDAMNLKIDTDPNRKLKKKRMMSPSKPKLSMVDCPQCPTRFDPITKKPISFKGFKGLDVLRKHVKEVHTHATPLKAITPKGEQVQLNISTK